MPIQPATHINWRMAKAYETTGDFLLIVNTGLAPEVIRKLSKLDNVIILPREIRLGSTMEELRGFIEEVIRKLTPHLAGNGTVVIPRPKSASGFKSLSAEVYPLYVDLIELLQDYSRPGDLRELF